jgi:hypothetical protein
VAELRIGLPEAQEVLGVTGQRASVNGGWSLRPLVARCLVVIPDKPLKDDYTFEFVFGGAGEGNLPAEVAVPEIEIVGASYARGQLIGQVQRGSWT